jgi:hypothetical protein
MRIKPWHVGAGLAAAWLLWPRRAKAQEVPTFGNDKMSDHDIAVLLYNTGWRMPDLETAVRIVLGESGGHIHAKNPNSSATGLFQVMASYHKGVDLLDPEVNAQEAWKLYQHDKGFPEGHGSWWGPTHYHTLKANGSADTDKIMRAKAAVESLG